MDTGGLHQMSTPAFAAALAEWKRSGAFPRIHDALAFQIIQSPQNVRLCDIACCHGLLGTRVGAVCGVEANPTFVAEAREAGIPLPIQHLQVSRYTLRQLATVLNGFHVKGVILRRAMPELWGKDPEGAELFSTTLAEAGITAIFLQCRVPSNNPATPFNSVADEIHPFRHHYAPIFQNYQIAELTLRR